MLNELAINLLASAILVAAGFVWGKFRERGRQRGKNLEEYDFYPFGVDDTGALYFDLDRFTTAVRALSRRRNDTAARQLILVGRQNDVRGRLAGDDLAEYLRFYDRHHGDDIHEDTQNFLANFKRIVQLVGDSFPDTGIEILLHDLTNPTTALSVIKNNVTGRNVEAPATNLVFDLKRRRAANQDKLNYELNIGARRFKCTTIPIFRDKDGLVGAICINVDYRYIDEEVRRNAAAMDAFFRNLLKTDMQLDENILSKAEYRRALAGKRHFRDHDVVTE